MSISTESLQRLHNGIERLAHSEPEWEGASYSTSGAFTRIELSEGERELILELVEGITEEDVQYYWIMTVNELGQKQFIQFESFPEMQRELRNLRRIHQDWCEATEDDA